MRGDFNYSNLEFHTSNIITQQLIYKRRIGTAKTRTAIRFYDNVLFFLRCEKRDNTHIII